MKKRIRERRSAWNDFVLFSFHNFLLSQNFFADPRRTKLSSHLDFTFSVKFIWITFGEFSFCQFWSKAFSFNSQTNKPYTNMNPWSQPNPEHKHGSANKESRNWKNERYWKRKLGGRIKAERFTCENLLRSLKLLPGWNVLREFILPQKWIKRKLLRLKSFANKTI